MEEPGTRSQEPGAGELRTVVPAKINWTLEVLGRREDGYHEIRSVMQTIDLCDELWAELGEELRFEADDGTPLAEDDLVVRAGRALARALGGNRGAHVQLKKRIPVGSGLGGGSSDAAASLRMLNRLWAPGVSAEHLHRLAEELGSDAPFFLYGGTALVESKGEHVTPLGDAPKTWLLVAVTASEALPDKTRRMYQALTADDFSDGLRSQVLSQRLRQGNRVREGDLHNVFERVAYKVFEGLETYRNALLAAGAGAVHLAGAGPALFALAESETDPKDLAGRVQATGAKVFVTRTLGTREATAVTD